MTAWTRGDEDEDERRGSGEQSFGTGRGGVTQGVGRYVRVWMCVVVAVDSMRLGGWRWEKVVGWRWMRGQHRATTSVKSP